MASYTEFVQEGGAEIVVYLNGVVDGIPHLKHHKANEHMDRLLAIDPDAEVHSVQKIVTRATLKTVEAEEPPEDPAPPDEPEYPPTDPEDPPAPPDEPEDPPEEPAPPPVAGDADQVVQWGANGVLGGPGLTFKPDYNNGRQVMFLEPDGRLRQTLTSEAYNPRGFEVALAAAGVREIWERFYLTFDPDWTMNQPGCGGSGSSGQKINLWYVAGGSRVDLILRDGDVSLTMNRSSYASDWPPRVNGNALNDGVPHLFELHINLGTPGQNDAALELWIDGQPVHGKIETDDGGAPRKSSPAGAELKSATWVDTYNCEEELGQTQGKSMTQYVSPIERWWSSVPAWYDQKPATERY